MREKLNIDITYTQACWLWRETLRRMERKGESLSSEQVKALCALLEPIGSAVTRDTPIAYAREYVCFAHGYYTAQEQAQ